MVYASRAKRGKRIIRLLHIHNMLGDTKVRYYQTFAVLILSSFVCLTACSRSSANGNGMENETGKILLVLEPCPTMDKADEILAVIGDQDSVLLKFTMAVRHRIAAHREVTTSTSELPERIRKKMERYQALHNQVNGLEGDARQEIDPRSVRPYVLQFHGTAAEAFALKEQFPEIGSFQFATNHEATINPPPNAERNCLVQNARADQIEHRAREAEQNR